MDSRARVLILGAGEHASGTAHRLFRCGFVVVMTDLASPRAVRRKVSFSSAILEGEITVEGVRGIACGAPDPQQLASLDGASVAVFVDPLGELKKLWRPDVIIDARIAKRNLDNRLDDAPLVIGYGPGLVAGRDVHFVVETRRSHDLGRILAEGMASPDTGIPGEIAGVGAARVLRAPAAGLLRTCREIGDLVQAGDVIARVGDQPVKSAIAGVVRGLLQSGVPVEAKQKLGDVDPRGDPAACTTLSDKTRALSGAALEIIVSRFLR
jgi:xanthine dehydrogenase accessory factor